MFFRTWKPAGDEGYYPNPLAAPAAAYKKSADTPDQSYFPDDQGALSVENREFRIEIPVFSSRQLAAIRRQLSAIC